MADILPFMGTRFNSQLIGNLSKVLSPPYDVISPEQQEDLYERHPNNVVRLELAKDDTADDNFSNRYTRAANAFRTWRSDGILIEDEVPALYLYEQEFKLPGGETRRRRGFFSLVKLEDYKTGGIKAHEHTFAHHKNDRLQLMRSTHANLSPIFVIYNDPKNDATKLIAEKMKEKPWEEATDDDGVIHRLWVVQKKEFVTKMRELLKERELFIADGHHRYETALMFRDEMREEYGKKDEKQPYDYMMMYLTNAEQDGLVILPTHRALSRQFVQGVDLKAVLEEIREAFDVTEDKVDIDKPGPAGKKILQNVQKLGEQRTSFAMVLPTGKVYYLKLKKKADPTEFIDDDSVPDEVKALDVSVLHHFIINQICIGNPEYELEDDECWYVRDVSRVFELLKTKKAGMAFIMNATPMEQVIDIVSAGIKMPHKSTYFHPKIITGLVIRNIDCEMKKIKAAKR